MPQRYTRNTPHYGALCLPVLISKCTRQFYQTQRERENAKGVGKKGRARQRRTFVVWVSSFPSPPPFYNPVRSAPTKSTHTKRDYSSKVPCCTSREQGGEGAPLFRGTTAQDVGMLRTGPPLSAHCRPPLGISLTPTERSHSSDSATAVLLRQAPLREEARSTSARLVPPLPSWSAATAAHEMALADCVVSSGTPAECRGPW